MRSERPDGHDAARVLDRLAELRAEDAPIHGGRVLSYVYDAGRPDLERVAAEAAAMVAGVNGLDPIAFGSVGTLERDLVAFGRGVLHGDGDVVGSVTSGGTESCLLALKSARDRHRASAPGPARAAVVLPTTAHPAFRKAAHYLDVDVVEVPVGTSTAVDASRVLAAVDAVGPRAALVVASAPSYPTGTCDPVAKIAAGCADRGLDLHVDACIGGFVLPWWPAPLDPWDLAVPGVTSISADLHKYGFAPKGVSLLLHRGRERHRAQYWASSAWPGYPVVNPTVLGTRSVTAMAAAWAITRVLGEAGYAALVARTAAATTGVRDVVASLEGVRLLGRPDGPLLALVADTAAPESARVDPFLLVDAVRGRGFALQAQPSFIQPDATVVPRSAHATITPVTLDRLQELSAALEAGAAEVRGRAAPAPDPTLVERVLRDGVPEETATLMTTLEALPDDVAPAALAQVLAAVIDPGR